MSQQSNPATLREALSELRCVADNLYMNLKAAAQFNPEGFNTPALEQVFQRFKTAAAKSVEIEAALAACGTEAYDLDWDSSLGKVWPVEAAPVCNLCHHSLVDNNHGFDQNDASMDGDKLVHSGYCTYCKLCQAQPAQAAASPEPFVGVDLATGNNWMVYQCPNCRCELRQSAAPSGGADYHRGAKEAFQRVVDEWPTSRNKVQSWANNCAVYEQQHRLAQESKTGAAPSNVRHGYDCVKVMHRPDRIGYLHGEYDDGPYDVDGVNYCGRCHLALPGETGAVTETK